MIIIRLLIVLEIIKSNKNHNVMAWDKKETADLNNIMFGVVEDQVKSHYEQIEADIDFILRSKIEKPIKGEITKGKLRWRGIEGIAYDTNNNFIGIIQRGKLVSKQKRKP